MAKKAARTKPEPAPVQVPEEPKVWEMPKPCRGQAVVFYYRATVSERNADMAFVTSVGEKSIDVAFRGQGYSECMHISDPRLAENPDLRQEIGGLWKYTDEKLENDEKFVELEKRLKRLESLIGDKPQA